MAVRTKSLLASGHIEKARQLIDQAAEMYRHGDILTRNLVSNVYVFSISSYIELYDKNLLKLLPDDLKREFHEIVGSQAK